MVNTRSKASKQRDKGKQTAVENPPGGSDASPAQTSGENSVGHPTAPQFMIVEQLGEALKQVQEAVIKGVCEQMKVPNLQPIAELGSALREVLGKLAEQDSLYDDLQLTSRHPDQLLPPTCLESRRQCGI